RFTGGSDELLQEAEKEVNALEKLISVTLDSSEVFRLNRDGECRISYETALLLGRALALCEETDGAMDISIYPLVREWGFTTGNYHVPPEEVIEALLEHVNYKALAMDSDIVTLPPQMAVDFGSIAKGFTGDRILQLLREGGVTSAILALGGNIQTLGTKPDGSLWRVAVQDPAGDGYAGILSVADSAVITSGGYDRYFEDEDGHIWLHILDPKTGYPAENGLISVTVVGEEGARCDALSTALFVMGEDEAIRFWRVHRDFEMVLITDDQRLLITSRWLITSPISNLRIIIYRLFRQSKNSAEILYFPLTTAQRCGKLWLTKVFNS
ncbi:MAG: FAD:protein FMN transferase, partial [Eubacterium sp.]|nr:FAD:protein FMN transferase [Eubacterium sp.]